jgi:hypothetical protein
LPPGCVSTTCPKRAWSSHGTPEFVPCPLSR